MSNFYTLYALDKYQTLYDSCHMNHCGHLKERPIVGTRLGGYYLDCKLFVCNDCAKVIFCNNINKENRCCISVCKKCIHLYKYQNTEYRCVEKECKKCEENRPNIFVRFVESMNDKLNSFMSDKRSRKNDYYTSVN